MFQPARPPVNVSISYSAPEALGLPSSTWCWSTYGSRERGSFSLRAPSACCCPGLNRVHGGKCIIVFLGSSQGWSAPWESQTPSPNPKSSGKKEGTAKAVSLQSISSPFHESFCSALVNAINILAALIETTCMAWCSMTEWISNSLVLKAKATFITYRSWLSEWFVAPLGQSRRERERFSPRFQMNKFVL